MILITLLIIILIIVVYIWWNMNFLQVSKYEIRSTKLSKDFHNFKIAHISDFHNTRSNILKKQLIKAITKENPDIIVITGDLIDRYKLDLQISLDFVKKIKQIPIYYVAGNHESWIKEYPGFKNKMIEMGVNLLENNAVLIKKGKSKVKLIGLQDPTFETQERNVEQMKIIVDKYLDELCEDNYFQMVLLHRPELLDILAKHNIDLAFAGHAHGGQFIIPFIGPFLAPNQGFFPKLTSGVNKQGGTNLVISRGIGNSSVPIRFNNNPELVCVTLKNND